MGATLSTILVCSLLQRRQPGLEPVALVDGLPVLLLRRVGQLLDPPLQHRDVLLGLGRLGADVGRVARQQLGRLVEHRAQPDDLLLVLLVALVDLVQLRAQVGDVGAHLLALAGGHARGQARARAKRGQQRAARDAAIWRLLPGEVDTAILRPARLIGSLGVQRPARQHGQLDCRRRPAGPGGRAPTARAARTAPGCTPGCRAGRCGRSACAGRPTFLRQSASRASTAVASVVSADSLKSKNTASSVHCAGGGGGVFSLLQNPSMQSSSCGQSLSVLHGFFARAGPLDAVLAARAFLVVRARLALVGDALLVRGAVGLAAAVAGDRLALAGVAGAARRAVVRVAALLALAATQNSFVVAVLVGLARWVVRFAPRRAERDGDGDERERQRAHPRGAARRASDRMLGHWGPPRRGKPYVPRATMSTRDRRRLGDPGRFRSPGDGRGQQSSPSPTRCVLFERLPPRRQPRVKWIIAHLSTMTPPGRTCGCSRSCCCAVLACRFPRTSR